MNSGHITIEEIKGAYGKVAQLVMIDRRYLPIFERLEKEIAAHEINDDLFQRALAVANG